MKPNCYNCHHRGAIPGDAHSICNHPDIKSPLLEEIIEMLNIGESEILNPGAVDKLGIRASEHGVAQGWFNWPVNFDPVWLTACNGYDPIEVPWWEDSGQ